jgi:ATP-dependent helicase/nuclease subunit B
MEPGIVAALAAGRAVIVPSVQRAAALRWNWARLQLAQGRGVWATPEIITWDAWLEAQWEKAYVAGRLEAGTRRLNRSQQLQLWQRVLVALESDFGEAADLAQHAAALMDSATRAVQWQLQLSRLAITDEEKLLATALVQAREWCRQHGCVVLSLCMPDQLGQFLSGPAPLVTGQGRLTALQQAVGARCWPGEQLLHQPESRGETSVRLVSADSLEDEIRACARWCEDHLTADPERRLLVISATPNPSAEAQGTLLARELCAGTTQVPEDILEEGLLAVEGGRALSHQQLIADVLCALRLVREPLSFDDLSRVLRSPYLAWGSPSQLPVLEAKLAEAGFAQWRMADLEAVLARYGADLPSASAFSAWLGEARTWPRRAARVEWARHFSRWLGAARFARDVGLDSRDAQRLQRWNELLDEFAALDAIGDPLALVEALEELLQLAAQARHAARSGDAAITLTAERGAPLACYDGIWVLGLAEQRWPEPPRPDPYVPLSEQRRCGWDESGARQRLEQAQWSLRQWRDSTAELVLSHPRLEGDVHHRPSALPGLAVPHAWQQAVEARSCFEPFSAMPAVPPTPIAPMDVGKGRPLRQGQQRLKLQQACAFRAQAEIRLGATQAATISDGIHPKVRGVLLHGVLDGLWRDLGDQRALNAQDETARQALFERHWLRQLAQRAAQGHPSYPPRVVERERLRSEKLILRVLQVEEARPYFRVLCGERQVQLATSAGAMTLRVDRIDEDEQGRRWLIDYKSGMPESFRLAQGEARPLQLALYEQALAAEQEQVYGMALLSLAPAKTGFSGAAPESGWPGTWQRIADWDEQRERWRAELESLLRAHTDGDASVAPLRDACRNCHLPGLCRRADPAADADADADEDMDGSAAEQPR